MRLDRLAGLAVLARTEGGNVMNLDHEEEVHTQHSQADALREEGGVDPSGHPPLPTPDEIVREHGPRVYGMARRMLANEKDAEDVTQDTLLQVLRKLPSFRGESSFPTWLHRVAVNAVLAFRRKKATRQEHVSPGPVEDMPDDGGVGGPVRRWMAPPSDLIIDRETARLIEEAVEALPEVYRDVFVLADVEGMPNAEAAEALGLSLPAVKSRLHRARLLLRKALSPYFEEVAS